MDCPRFVGRINNYLYTKEKPLRDEVIEVMNERPTLRERGKASKHLIDRIKDFVVTFIDGMG